MGPNFPPFPVLGPFPTAGVMYKPGDPMRTIALHDLLSVLIWPETARDALALEALFSTEAQVNLFVTK